MSHLVVQRAEALRNGRREHRKPRRPKVGHHHLLEQALEPDGDSMHAPNELLLSPVERVACIVRALSKREQAHVRC